MLEFYQNLLHEAAHHSVATAHVYGLTPSFLFILLSTTTVAAN
jgi:hypothetical protein